MSPTGMRNGRSGFTLVEMLVVLLALVILAAAVVPSLRGGARRGDLDGAAARVAATARFARETAADRGVTVALTVETAPQMVRLEPEDETNPTSSPLSVGGAAWPSRGGSQTPSMPLTEKFARVRLPEGVTAHLEPAPDAGQTRSPQAATDALRFPPDGRTLGGVIVLNDARGREVRVLVAPDTAQVTSLRGE